MRVATQTIVPVLIQVSGALERVIKTALKNAIPGGIQFFNDELCNPDYLGQYWHQIGKIIKTGAVENEGSSIQKPLEIPYEIIVVSPSSLIQSFRGSGVVPLSGRLYADQVNRFLRDVTVYSGRDPLVVVVEGEVDEHHKYISELIRKNMPSGVVRLDLSQRKAPYEIKRLEAIVQKYLERKISVPSLN